jgi:hypothetical protein
MWVAVEFGLKVPITRKMLNKLPGGEVEKTHQEKSFESMLAQNEVGNKRLGKHTNRNIIRRFEIFWRRKPSIDKEHGEVTV